MRIYYQSGSDERKIYLDQPPYWLQNGDFLDYEKEYILSGKRIKKIENTLQEKEFIITIFGNTEEEYEENINILSEIFEKDAIKNISGKLYFGEYYRPCFIYASEKTEWEYDCLYMDNALKLIETHPFWIKEHTYVFKASIVTSTNNKRYPGRYAYRYANGLSNTYIVNDHYAECNFKINIYGPCTKPSVYIGGYEYHVDIVLQAGEYLEIDSAAETVTKVMTSGIRVNAFNNRSFVNSVFRPIQTGKQEIFWDGKFDFDLILFEERSEPKWQ